MSHNMRLVTGKTVLVGTYGLTDSSNQKVQIGNYVVLLQDFLVAAHYILTNVDVPPNDPRLAFVRLIKTMKLVPGFNPEGERLKGESWAVDAFYRHDRPDVSLRE